MALPLTRGPGRPNSEGDGPAPDPGSQGPGVPGLRRQWPLRPHTPSPVPRCHAARPHTEAHGSSPPLGTPPLCTPSSGPSCPRRGLALPALPSSPRDLLCPRHPSLPGSQVRAAGAGRGGRDAPRDRKRTRRTELGLEGCGPELYSS
ncbi:hypothetical protein MDA_GLEAN10006256 [Myotis davidii]|uniref:Uncharacterized protein n=1 Tax=Myotis davidii TaxID=225400 RepID=L5MB31_MYODS|nr:hypothetical protein MDA_GLEAN10006256 [Myotis davidii]